MANILKNVFKDLVKSGSPKLKSKLLLGNLSNRTASTANIMNTSDECTDVVWIDLEMTGLDVRKDKILEFSCLITDKFLNIKDKGLSVVIQQSKEVLDNMDPWCIKHHNETGLVQQCLSSTVTHAEAESKLLEYLKCNIAERKCPLAGNSIYMDRFFLIEHMPSVHEYLHYRIIDTSTIKELCKRWNTDVYERAPQKKCVHRSLDDIKESIAELKYYRQNFFKSSS